MHNPQRPHVRESRSRYHDKIPPCRDSKHVGGYSSRRAAARRAQSGGLGGGAEKREEEEEEKKGGKRGEGSLRSARVAGEAAAPARGPGFPALGKGRRRRRPAGAGPPAPKKQTRPGRPKRPGNPPAPPRRARRGTRRRGRSLPSDKAPSSSFPGLA